LPQSCCNGFEVAKRSCSRRDKGRCNQDWPIISYTVAANTNKMAALRALMTASGMMSSCFMATPASKFSLTRRLTSVQFDGTKKICDDIGVCTNVGA
jgi:hypothetical protein